MQEKANKPIRKKPQTKAKATHNKSYLPQFNNTSSTTKGIIQGEEYTKSKK